jgi:4-hydroxy-2-oxoheptanedioate aldolase
MVNTKAQCEAAVRSCRYVPEGARSWGPVMSSMRHEDYRKWATENVAVIPMIETVDALENIDDILSVPGVSAIYVGPADLSISLGLAKVQMIFECCRHQISHHHQTPQPHGNDANPVFVGALTKVVAACKKRGIIAGIHSTGTLAPERHRQGFRLMTVASDMTALAIGYKSEMETYKSGIRKD